MDSLAIILARGGSKGIINKNLTNFCGKPLIQWTIEHCKNSEFVNEIYVSSDSDEILNFANSTGVKTILRPRELSTDNSSSEDAWMHALEFIYKERGCLLDFILAPQVTSPIRDRNDFDNAIKIVIDKKLDSLLSVNEIKDFFIWEIKNKNFTSSNYDFKNRLRRQLINPQYHENGSFYIFKPEILKKYKNRLGGKIGYYIMEEFKSFQIDEFEDLKFCEIIMNGYMLNENK